MHEPHHTSVISRGIAVTTILPEGVLRIICYQSIIHTGTIKQYTRFGPKPEVVRFQLACQQFVRAALRLPSAVVLLRFVALVRGRLHHSAGAARFQ